MSRKTELQQYLNASEQVVKMQERVERLKANSDFIEIIEKGFCQDEMQRCMSLAISTQIPPETRELCNQLAKASAALDNYLKQICRDGDLAKEDIANTLEELDRIEFEGNEE